MNKFLTLLKVWGLIAMQFQGIVAYSETTATTDVSKLTEKEISDRRNARHADTDIKKRKAFQKFNEAVLNQKLDDVGKEIKGIEDLTGNLNTNTSGAVGLERDTGRVNGQGVNLASWEPEKIRKLKAEITLGQKELKKKYNLFKKCKSFADRVAVSSEIRLAGKCNSYNDIMALSSEIRLAEKILKDKQNLLVPSTATRAKARTAAATVQASIPTLNKMNATKDALYAQKDKYLRLVKANAPKSVALANEATAIAMELIGSEVNNQFILSKITGKTDNNDIASHNINVLSLTAASTFHLKCIDISDCPSVAYALQKAATAIYIATKVRETGDNIGNSLDALKSDYYDLDDKYDDQIKAYERAAGVKHQLLDSTLVQKDSKEKLEEMFKWVNLAAQQELWGKQMRVAAAEQQLGSSNAHKKHSTSAIETFKRIVQIASLAVSAAQMRVASSCSGPGCGAALAHLAAMKKWLAAMKVILAFWKKDDKKADRSIAKSKTELTAANIHTHMDCSPTKVPSPAK